MYRFREPVNGFTHLVGALLAAAGLVWLMTLTWDNSARLVVVVIYGVCTIALYLASATYHLTNGSDIVLLWLRRFDHAAIYLMIAGTYTPILYTRLEGGWRWGMLALVWGLAFAGIGYKLLFLREGSLWSLFYYIAMGCVGLVALPVGLTVLPRDVILLLMAGGLCYLLGALIFGIQKPNFHPHFGHHEIWHLCVLGGSGFHFGAILLCLA